MTKNNKGQDSKSVVSVQTMLKAVESQADMIPGLIDYVKPQVKKVVSKLDIENITNIFTTGCGDSYFGPLATRLTFEKYTGFRTEAIQALEFSRYTVDFLPPGSLVIGISAGGDKSRSVEALVQANRVGATTIAITGNLDSPMAREADAVIIQNESDFRIPPPPGERTTGLANYHATLLVLYLLAIEIGLAKGSLQQSTADELLAGIYQAPEIIRATIKYNDKPIREYAQSVSQESAYYFLGGGPNYATALFTAAKLFEQPQLNGVPQELEEWAHMQYFLTRPGTPVIVITPPGNSVDRAREQMKGAKDMGARVVAICDQDDHETMALADVTFPIKGKLLEELSPLTYCIPGELFATYLCAALGKPASEWISLAQHEVNMRQISQSHIRGK
jgi:glucosamine--fructose-6-phosphate aminotransferase (isomerizing)